MTTSALIGLFLCGAVLSLFSAAAGAFLTLWTMHVGRTGAHPLPRLPSVRLFRRPTGEAEENGQAEPPRRRVGP